MLSFSFSRMEGSSKASQMNRPLTPSEQINKMKTSPKKRKPEKQEKQEKAERPSQHLPSSQGSNHSQTKNEPGKEKMYLA